MASYRDLPDCTEPNVTHGLTTRWFDLGPLWVARAQFAPVETATRFGYDGWTCDVDVFRRDTIRAPHKRLRTFGPPLGQSNADDGGCGVKRRRGAEAASVDDIIAAAEQVISEHGPAWEQRWLHLPPPATITGAEIAAIRESLGMTQIELAEALGATQTTISRWERNASPVASPRTLRLALERLLDRQAAAPR